MGRSERGWLSGDPVKNASFGKIVLPTVLTLSMTGFMSATTAEIAGWKKRLMFLFCLQTSTQSLIAQEVTEMRKIWLRILRAVRDWRCR